MKCDECLRLLDLYHDGELDAAEASAVASHLGGCGPCAREHRRLAAEQSLYLRYGCDATESPAFWDEVLAKAAAGGASAPGAFAARLRRRLAGALATLAAPRFTPTVTAAMLAAAVGLTAAAMIYLRPRDAGPRAVAEHGRAGNNESAAPRPGLRDDAAPGDADDAGRRRPIAAEAVAESVRGKREAGRPGAAASRRARQAHAPVAAEDAADKLILEAERKYLAAIAALSRDVGRRRPKMDAEAATHFERTLAVVDRAIAETRAAARRHPRDPVAVQYMMAAYAKKVDLLREMAQD